MRIALISNTHRETEDVVYWLASGLVRKRQHIVTLFGGKGTQLPGGNAVELPRFKASSQYVNAMLPHLNEFDVFHDCTDGNKFATMFEHTVPCVSTIFGDEINVEKYPVCTSKMQAEKLGCERFILNGLLKELMTYTKNKEKYVLFLGDITKDSGAQFVFDKVIPQMNVHFVFEGDVAPDMVDAFNYRRQHSPNVEHVGRMTNGARRTLISRAGCVIVAYQREPVFPLSVLEAMASGTPVVAGGWSNLMPEYIKDGVNGYVADDPINFRNSIHRALNGTVSPMLCYEHYRGNFSAERAAEQYGELYEEVKRNW